jgi:hypothetical protein
MQTRPWPAVGLAALLLGLGAGGAQAQVWKCRDAGGSINFSDKPCPGQGEPVQARQLQANVADAPRPVPASAARPGEAAASPQPPGNDCPGDQELRDMETRANSRSLGEAEKAFMQDEIRRVRQCRKGQGRYTAEDWRISRDAQAAQSSSNAADARRRAEGMHSAADPLEGERIAQQRQEIERQERLGAQRRKRLAQPPCPAGSLPGTPAQATCR